MSGAANSNQNKLISKGKRDDAVSLCAAPLARCIARTRADAGGGTRAGRYCQPNNQLLLSTAASFG